MRVVIAVLFVAGRVWSDWWFFGVFNANLASPGGLLMGGLMVLLPIIGLLTVAGLRQGAGLGVSARAPLEACVCWLMRNKPSPL